MVVDGAAGRAAIPASRRAALPAAWSRPRWHTGDRSTPPCGRRWTSRRSAARQRAQMSRPNDAYREPGRSDSRRPCRRCSMPHGSTDGRADRRHAPALAEEREQVQSNSCLRRRVRRELATSTAPSLVDLVSQNWDNRAVRRVPPADETPLHWVGAAKRDFLAFPTAAKEDMGNAFGIAQFGGTAPTAKPWKGLARAYWRSWSRTTATRIGLCTRSGLRTPGTYSTPSKRSLRLVSEPRSGMLIS